MIKERMSSLGRGALGVAMLLGVWQLVVTYGGMSETTLPPPLVVIRTLHDEFGTIQSHLMDTLWASLAGFGIALVCAALSAFLVDLLGMWGELLVSPVVALQNVPKVAVAPLLVIWFSHGLLPKIVMSALIAFFPIFEGFREGLVADKTGLRSVMRVLGFGWWKIFWKVKVPEAVAHATAAAKVGATFAVIGTIVGELEQPSSGLGFLMKLANQDFRTDLQLASVIAVSALGVAIYGLLQLVELTPFLRRYQFYSANEAEVAPSE